jgi:isoleucyl-tRNA synthetase
VRISDKLMEVPSEAYRRARNTLRFLLGNLDDFAAADAVPYARLPELERFVLLRLAELQRETLADYREYRYRAAARRLSDFCGELSSLFLDATKDRMYTFRADSPERRAAQTAMAEVLPRLCALLSPILSFTADEAWGFWKGRPAGSVFLWDLPEPPAEWSDPALAARWSEVLALRERVQKKIEEARAAKIVGSSLQAEVVLDGDPAQFRGLALEEILIVSKASWGPALEVKAAPGAKCPRCWRWQADIGSVPAQPELCARCARQLS